MGIGSNIHQVAQTTVMAAVQQAGSCQPIEMSSANVIAASNGPRARNSRDVFIWLILLVFLLVGP